MSLKEREPVVRGMFYPAGKDNLQRMISSFLIDANPKENGDKDILGIISPHAGYVYSGSCAAFAYKLLKNKSFDTVIVLGPSHSTLLKGASVWKEGVYKTPLGDIKIDEEFTKILLEKGPDIEFYQVAHIQEHSIEVQLPFLQYVLKGKFELVPIIIGNQTYEYSKRLSNSLFELIEESSKKIIIVASSDLSHYHSHEVAKRMDRIVVDLVRVKNVDKLSEVIESGKGEACGIGPIFTLLNLALKYKNSEVEILNVINSGDVSGDKSRVVGYMSAVIYK